MGATRDLLFRLFPPLRIRAKLWTWMVVLAVYGLLAHLVIAFEGLPPIDWGSESTVLNGLVLGFFIAFRNNNAYSRWWEARQLWGKLTNDVRNLCLKVRALPDLEAADRVEIGRLLIAFAWTLLNHLRLKQNVDEPPTSAAAASTTHAPSRVAGELIGAIARLRSKGRLDGWTVLWLDAETRGLMDVCGACERIRNTPLSSSYRALLRHGIAVYLAIAPFYLMEDVGLAGFPMFLLAAYFILGIEMVAEEIEEPFGLGGDNLPLERYCATIENSTREILSLTASSPPTIEYGPGGSRPARP